ncbi:MAG: ATP-dependent endonuclease, partial [Holophagales bacterium]|nr:ATP-dependent endonuclease [Holophagales bacterium]
VVSQLAEDPFAAGEGRQEERERLRAAIDFHPTVCEAFFARHALLVEGDTEVAILRHSRTLLQAAGVDDARAREVSVVSCGGKWTIVPVARLLSQMEVPFRILHDEDRKGLSDEELKERKSHPWWANERIRKAAGAASIRLSRDTAEDVLWPDTTRGRGSSDKPYRAWARVREILETDERLDGFPELRKMVRFAYDT